MTYIPDYRVLHNPGAVFRPSKTIKNVPAKVKTVKIRDALPSDYSDIINDASMEVERITLEMSKRPTWIPQSDKAPLVRTRTDVATAKLMGDIEAVIDRSKRISIKSTEMELYDLELMWVTCVRRMCVSKLIKTWGMFENSNVLKYSIILNILDYWILSMFVDYTQSSTW